MQTRIFKRAPQVSGGMREKDESRGKVEVYKVERAGGNRAGPLEGEHGTTRAQDSGGEMKGFNHEGHEATRRKAWKSS
jgi:hypothetical protein